MLLHAAEGAAAEAAAAAAGGDDWPNDLCRASSTVAPNFNFFILAATSVSLISS